MTDEELDAIDPDIRRIEIEGVQNIIKYFDRIHDILSTFNNILIGCFFALANFANQLPKWTVLIPIFNLAILLIVEYRMMEKSRFEANIRNKNKQEIVAHGLSIKRTNLYSLLIIVSTAMVTLSFLYALLFVNVSKPT
ncbi:MAG: hypothetical protein UZ12_BCD005003323 [Bacteroidetes bacterium OLB12]|nr:MAG: hypothetical protein UZ12_BCD005003323 [Bacteroidetes bacterium OLB12]HNU41655.1 hypothetical protein [Cyclobacteriaceae bacterium]